MFINSLPGNSIKWPGKKTSISGDSSQFSFKDFISKEKSSFNSVENNRSNGKETIRKN